MFARGERDPPALFLDDLRLILPQEAPGGSVRAYPGLPRSRHADELFNIASVCRQHWTTLFHKVARLNSTLSQPQQIVGVYSDSSAMISLLSHLNFFYYHIFSILNADLLFVDHAAVLFPLLHLLLRECCSIV
jgi:hypothetical protein